MRKTNSRSQQHILEVTAAMIEESGSANVHLATIAQKANVGIPTIYYHFTSLPQLISAAQGLRHQELWAPFDDILTSMTRAVDNEDEDAYWEAWDQLFFVGWDSRHREGMRHFAELLIDVRRDPIKATLMKDKQVRELERRIAVIENAKSLGWLDPDVDPRTLSLVFWASFVGLHLNYGSDIYDVDTEKVKSLFMKVARGQRDRTDQGDH